MSAETVVQVSGDLGPQVVRKVWYTAKTIDATNGSRVGAPIDSTGVLQIGHPLVLDPYDNESQGVGNTFGIPTASYLKGTWGVVVAIHDAVNVGTDSGKALNLTTNPRRGGWVSVCVRGYVQGILDGTTDVAVYDALKITPGSSGAMGKFEKGTQTANDDAAEQQVLQAVSLVAYTTDSTALKNIAIGGFLGLGAG